MHHASSYKVRFTIDISHGKTFSVSVKHFLKLSQLSTYCHVCYSPPCLFLLHYDVSTLNDGDRRYAREQRSDHMNSDSCVVRERM